MLQCLEHLPKPMPQLEVLYLTAFPLIQQEHSIYFFHRPRLSSRVFPQDYLDMVGLSAMFPRVEVFLIQGSPVDMLDQPLMDGEESSGGRLNNS